MSGTNPAHLALLEMENSDQPHTPKDNLTVNCVWAPISSQLGTKPLSTHFDRSHAQKLSGIKPWTALLQQTRATLVSRALLHYGPFPNGPN